jgi:putative membrane protein
MMYWGTGMGGWAILLMTVSNLLFLGLLIAGAIALIRYTSRSARQDSAAEPAPDRRRERPTPQTDQAARRTPDPHRSRPAAAAGRSSVTRYAAGS